MARLSIRSRDGRTAATHRRVAATHRRAAATHRRAAALVAASESALSRHVPLPRTPAEEERLRELAGQLSAAAARLAPGWSGAPLGDVPPADAAPAGLAEFVRIGVGHALDDAPFPVVVPLGHVAFEQDCRDARVAGAVQALLLRLLAGAPAGQLLVRVLDPDDLVAERFAPLHDAGIMPPAATDRAGLDAVLTEAEHWVRGRPRDRTLLLVIAGWPAATTAADTDRVATLAEAVRGLHVVVTGWPPPAAAPPAGRAALPLATRVALRYAHATVGFPSGGPFASPARPPAGLDADVLLDPAPPPDLVDQVCRRLAGQAIDDARISLGELLPAGPLWAEDAADGLAVVIGRSGDAPVTLRLGGAFWHWLVGGRRGSGLTTLLHSVVYGLASRYGPDQLAIHLLDPAGDAGFTDLAAAVPHVRTVAVGGEVPAAVRDIAAGTADSGPAQALCVVDGLSALSGAEDLAALRGLAKAGHAQGLHLVLATAGAPPPGIGEQCRVRIALPGGRVLDPANDAAAGLANGRAIVNTASGLGGPRGATRAHEQLISFCDPYADRVALAGLRHRLSSSGSRS